MFDRNRTYLKEEGQAEGLRRYNERNGYKGDKDPIAEAIEQVFASCGEPDVSFDDGILSGPTDALDRIRTRAGVPTGNKSYVAYTGRNGEVHVPIDEALEIARKLCAAEPSTVLTDVEATERDWSSRPSRTGGEYIIPLLNEYRAS